MNNTVDLFPAPRANDALLGHQSAEKELLHAWHSSRLPHAWLITGPRGIGKATLAFRFARWILSKGIASDTDLFDGNTELDSEQDLFVSPKHPSFHHITKGSHPNLLTVERSFDEKTKRLRKEIVVSDLRRVNSFFGSTANDGGWRIVIIDAADEMNRNSCNALLKILEEPPKLGLILLVAHIPGRLPPTIRSRCRSLSLKPLTHEECVQIIATQNKGVGEEDVRTLSLLASARPGYALKLAHHNGIELYREMMSLLDGLPELDVDRLYEWSLGFARKDSDARFDLLSDLLVNWITRGVFASVKDEPFEEIAENEKRINQRLFSPEYTKLWLEIWDKVSELIRLDGEQHLDRQQLIVTMFNYLANAVQDIKQ